MSLPGFTSIQRIKEALQSGQLPKNQSTLKYLKDLQTAYETEMSAMYATTRKFEQEMAEVKEMVQVVESEAKAVEES